MVAMNIQWKRKKGKFLIAKVPPKDLPKDDPFVQAFLL